MFLNSSGRNSKKNALFFFYTLRFILVRNPISNTKRKEKSFNQIKFSYEKLSLELPFFRASFLFFFLVFVVGSRFPKRVDSGLWPRQFFFYLILWWVSSSAKQKEIQFSSNSFKDPAFPKRNKKVLFWQIYFKYMMMVTNHKSLKRET